MFEINLIKRLSYSTFILAFLSISVHGQKSSIENLAKSVMLAGKGFNKIQDRHVAIIDSFSNLNSYSAHYYYLDTILHKAQKAKNDKLEAIIWMSRGNFFLGTGNSFKSIEAFRKSIAIMEKIDHPSGLCNAYTNMGNTYFYMFDYDKALSYYKTAISYCKKITDTTSNVQGKLANLYNNLGGVYCSRNDFVFGKTYFLMAQEIWKKEQDSISLAYAYNNFAQIFQEQNQPDSAEIYYDKALKLKLKHGSLADKSDGYRTAGMFYLRTDRIDIALDYLKTSLTYLDTNTFNRQLMYSYQLLNEIYARKKDAKNELRYFKLYTRAKDSTSSREKISNLTKLEMQFEFSKIHLADSIKSVEQIKLKDATISSKKQQSYFLIFILVLAVIVLGLIYSRFKLAKKQNVIIEAKNKEITDSINYARKIQQSILPNEKYFEKEIKRLKDKK